MHFRQMVLVQLFFFNLEHVIQSQSLIPSRRRMEEGNQFSLEKNNVYYLCRNEFWLFLFWIQIPCPIRNTSSAIDLTVLSQKWKQNKEYRKEMVKLLYVHLECTSDPTVRLGQFRYFVETTQSNCSFATLSLRQHKDSLSKTEMIKIEK